MTAAPADLLAHRATIRSITGLGAVEVGIAPDAAHLSGGGYHVGCEDIQRIGRWSTDYSTRQSRDRLDGTNTSSAEDIGDNWPNGGRAAWLRWNNFLYQEMRDRPQNLPALRAINVSLDGRTKRRYDQLNRGAGLVASTDTVDSHTHLEFWRDTEGRRGPTLDRITQLMRAAVANTAPALIGDDMANSWTFQDQAPADQWRITQNAGRAFLNGQARDTVLAMSAAASVEANDKLDRVLAADAADEVRDKALAATVEGLVKTVNALAAGTAAAGALDAAPLLQAIRDATAETHGYITALQEDLAASRQEATRLRAELAKALQS